jgi:hypothetical protein
MPTPFDARKFAQHGCDSRDCEETVRIANRLATYTCMRLNGCRGLRVLVNSANAFVFGLFTRE